MKPSSGPFSCEKKIYDACLKEMMKSRRFGMLFSSGVYGSVIGFFLSLLYSKYAFDHWKSDGRAELISVLAPVCLVCSIVLYKYYYLANFMCRVEFFRAGYPVKAVIVSKSALPNKDYTYRTSAGPIYYGEVLCRLIDVSHRVNVKVIAEFSGVKSAAIGGNMLFFCNEPVTQIRTYFPDARCLLEECGHADFLEFADTIERRLSDRVLSAEFVEEQPD